MGQAVLITGGAEGIGFGIAECFLREGARVHVCDTRKEAVAKASGSHERLTASLADVGSAIQVKEMVAEASGRLGPLDVLINNVGIAGPQAKVEDLSESDWDDTVRVNLSGAFYATKHAVPLMKSKGHGCVINISSVGTTTLPPNRSVYNASKWGLEGLTKSLARELGPSNIRCNAILPGVMNNARMNGIMQRRAEAENRPLDEVRREYIAYVPMGCLIDVDEIGDLAVFLASDKARHITGQLIAVCGGIQYEL